jgi:LuxR family maltose regulon positive regulatory protein
MQQNSLNEQINQSVTRSGGPVLDTARHFSRQRLIGSIQRRWTPEIKALLIEAQAGQGKTTLALEMLSGIKAGYAWCQLSSEHGDPVQFLAAMHHLFKDALSGFSSPLVETMLANGEIDALGANDALDRLLHSLQQHLQQDFHLVLDDVYLLDEFPYSLALINRLLIAAPARLKLVLISRTPILVQLQSDCLPELVLLIDTADLALNRSETAALFNNVLNLPIATGAVHSLHQATEGWIMGMMLVASKAEAAGMVVNNEALSAILAHGREGIPDYFIAEVLSKFPPALRRTLAKLALLQEIPLALAQQLSEVEAVEAVLRDLQHRNFFIRTVDSQQSIFIFHHLFQDCLRKLLEADFSSTEIELVQVEIADWYLSQKEYEKALNFYLRGHDYPAAQKVLQQVGMTLYAQNRIISLQSALSRAPEKILSDYPWLAYYRGIVAVNIDPPSALPLFELALDGFAASSDELGELMALVQVVKYHASVDGRHNLGYPLLERATSLYARLSEQLAPSLRINAANIFLLAFTLFNTELEKADNYLALGLKLAQEAGLENLEAEARMCRCYRHLFAGDLRACRREAEDSKALLKSPKVSPINKGLLQLAFVNMLEFEGDFPSYLHHQAVLRELLGAEIIDRSVMGAFLRLWDIDMELGLGNNAAARENIETAIAGGFAGANAHLRSQYLNYYAYLLALSDQTEQALAAAEESIVLREEAGGRYFEVITGTIVGATCALLGLSEKALGYFEWGLAKSQAIGEHFHRTSLYAHRADLHLDSGDVTSAHEDLRAMLYNLRQQGFSYFYFSSPRLMMRLLTEAVCSGIEVDYARKLAAERYEKAILTDGSLVPLLKIHTLGRFEVELNGRVVLRAQDLAASQRQLLGLLLTAPNQQLFQEDIQTTLWPDNTPAQSRSSFDNVVSRLRKTLQESFDDYSAKDYLVLQKSVLYLKHCRIDSVDFAATVKQGLGHARRKEFWQADNVFRKAMQLWQGEFMPGVALSEVAEYVRHDLLLLYLESAQKWCEILDDAGRDSDAIALCYEALRYEPTSQVLNRLLYNLHVNAGDNVQARKVLARYEEALQNNGFSSPETADILDEFWESSD